MAALVHPGRGVLEWCDILTCVKTPHFGKEESPYELQDIRTANKLDFP